MGQNLRLGARLSPTSFWGPRQLWVPLAAVSLALGGCQYLRELGSDEKTTSSGSADVGQEPRGEAPPASPPAPVEFQVGHWLAAGVLSPVVAEGALAAKQRKESAPGDTTSRGTEQVAADPLSIDQLRIDLQVNETGQVVGKVSCGDRQAELSGVFDEEKVRASFSGAQMTGTLLAARKDADLLGMVRVSLVERTGMQEEFRAFTADVTLKKK